MLTGKVFIPTAGVVVGLSTDGIPASPFTPVTLVFMLLVDKLLAILGDTIPLTKLSLAVIVSPTIAFFASVIARASKAAFNSGE